MSTARWALTALCMIGVVVLIARRRNAGGRRRARRVALIPPLTRSELAWMAERGGLSPDVLDLPVVYLSPGDPVPEYECFVSPLPGWTPPKET